jgi:hypothetical protein
MNRSAFAVPLLSFAVLLLAGCAEQPAPTTLTAAAGPSDSEANALVQKHLAALGAGLDLCLKDFAWPVTEDLTLGRDSAQPNVDSAEDLRLMQELETVGLAKSVVVRQPLTVNGTPVQVYGISYSLTPAAAPWLKDVSGPDFTKGGKQVPHKAVCFGKVIATHVQVLHAKLDGKGSQATAWKNDMDGLTRAYVRYTEKPDHPFADVEAVRGSEGLLVIRSFTPVVENGLVIRSRAIHVAGVRPGPSRHGPSRRSESPVRVSLKLAPASVTTVP